MAAIPTTPIPTPVTAGSTVQTGETSHQGTSSELHLYPPSLPRIGGRQFGQPKPKFLYTHFGTNVFPLPGPGTTGGPPQGGGPLLFIQSSKHFVGFGAAAHFKAHNAVRTLFPRSNFGGFGPSPKQLDGSRYIGVCPFASGRQVGRFIEI